MNINAMDYILVQKLCKVLLLFVSGVKQLTSPGIFGNNHD